MAKTAKRKFPKRKDRRSEEKVALMALFLLALFAGIIIVFFPQAYLGTPVEQPPVHQPPTEEPPPIEVPSESEVINICIAKHGYRANMRIVDGECEIGLCREGYLGCQDLIWVKSDNACWSETPECYSLTRLP